MNKKLSSKPSKQYGITLWHVLLLVAVAVTLAVCAKQGRLPISSITQNLQMPNISFPDNGGAGSLSSNESNNSNNWQQTNLTRASARSSSTAYNTPAGQSYDEAYPVNLDRQHGYYTVQVFSGYNSKSAYDLRRSLKKDGYNLQIDEEQTSNGILFKVRIGRYYNRTDAFAVNNQIRRRYPKTLGESFVMLVETNR